jgi:hypothetical protein
MELCNALTQPIALSSFYANIFGVILNKNIWAHICNEKIYKFSALKSSTENLPKICVRKTQIRKLSQINTFAEGPPILQIV